ncbi:hypothetical protein ACFL9U_12330, partial [Thermodesulfobacteriota bacterium]
SGVHALEGALAAASGAISGGLLLAAIPMVIIAAVGTYLILEQKKELSGIRAEGKKLKERLKDAKDRNRGWKAYLEYQRKKLECKEKQKRAAWKKRRKARKILEKIRPQTLPSDFVEVFGKIFWPAPPKPEPEPGPSPAKDENVDSVVDDLQGIVPLA